MVCVRLFPTFPRHVYMHKKGDTEGVCYYYMADSTVVVRNAGGCVPWLKCMTHSDIHIHAHVHSL